jgi:hypothetical protein
MPRAVEHVESPLARAQEPAEVREFTLAGLVANDGAFSVRRRTRVEVPKLVWDFSERIARGRHAGE